MDGGAQIAYTYRMNKRGFTIVELMVVIAIAVILMGITGVAALQVQKDARDKKREADITIMQSELEKYFETNGVYPPGCRGACSSWFYTENNATSGVLLNGDATISTIKTILPGIPKTFSDPQNSAASTPLALTGVYSGGASERYFYAGGAVNFRTSKSSIFNSTPAVNGTSCTFQQALEAGEVGSYVVGYYSEVSKQWIFKQGNRGVKATLTATSPDANACVM